MNDLIIMEAGPGEHVDDFAERMRVMANATNAPVLGEHNQYTLEARPGMKTRDILLPWHEAQRVAYLFGR